MKFLKQWLVAAAALALAPAALAQVTVSGVKYDETADVRGTKLQLNGAGVRYKAVFKVYTAGLYLTQECRQHRRGAGGRPAPSACPSPCCARSIQPNSGKLFSRGIEDNMDKAAFSKLIPGVLRMSQIFSDHKKLMPGETFLIDWIPGTGCVITVKGVPQGEPFKEPEFYNALLRIWLGPNPADWKLKEALLGKPA